MKQTERPSREEGVSPPGAFTGWTRNGYWQDGRLLNGRDGKVIHDPQAKLVSVKNASQAVQEGARRDMEKIWAMIPDFLTGTRHRKQAA